MPVVDANGLRLDCEVHGAADAPVVLLIMGLGMPAALWPDQVVQALTGAGFRVVTFDNRDSGGSTRLEGVPVPNVLRAIGRALLRRKVSAPYTLEDMAADTVGLLDALGIPQAHVVGASMGGMIGQVVAARHPARVLSLTSIMSNSGNPGRKYATFGSWKALRAIIHRPPPPDDHEAVVRHLIRLFSVIGSPRFRDDIELVRPVFERVARRGLYRSGTLRQLLAILATADRRPLLQRLEERGLVVRTRSSTDLGVVKVVLTHVGMKLAGRIPAIPQGLLLKGLSDIPPDQLWAVSQGLKSLVGILGARELTPRLFFAPVTNLPAGDHADWQRMAQPFPGTIKQPFASNLRTRRQ